MQKVKKLHYSEKKHRRTIKRKNKTYQPALPGFPKYHNKGKDLFVIIAAPEHLNCYDTKTYNTSIHFFNQITSIVNSQKTKRIVLDFSDTVTLKAIDIVVLFSIIEMSINTNKIKFSIRFSKTNSARGRIRDALIRGGLIHLCKFNSVNNTFDEPYLPVISGKGGNYREEIIDFLMKEIYKCKMEPQLELTYSSAIHEAINNVRAHAYKDFDEPKWWLKCSYIPDEGELYLVIYDQGVGIPNTFPNEEHKEQMRQNFTVDQSLIDEILDHFQTQGHIIDTQKLVENLSNNDKSNEKLEELPDELKIFLAMSGGLSGRATEAKQRKHGQGSISIRNLVKNNENGVLWIYSNNGLVKFYGDKMGTRPESRKLDLPIRGTIIQWNIKVEL